MSSKSGRLLSRPAPRRPLVLLELASLLAALAFAVPAWTAIGTADPPIYCWLPLCTWLGGAVALLPCLVAPNSAARHATLLVALTSLSNSGWVPPATRALLADASADASSALAAGLAGSSLTVLRLCECLNCCSERPFRAAVTPR